VIEVRPAAGWRARRRFINLPYTMYAADPMWVPPLRVTEWERLSRSKNPFFEHAELQPFLAWDGGRVRGRIAGIDDRLHRETHGENVAMFGFFEADGPETAAALLGAVERWARERGRETVRGPISPSLHDVAGLLIEGFDDRPFLLMPYNPPAYAGYIEGAGYAKVKDLYAWIFDVPEHMPPALERMESYCRKRYGLEVRGLERSRLAEEIAAFRTIYERAWQDNWGFVAPTAREFEHLAKSLNQIADPRLALSVSRNGGVVAFAVALPDLNQILPGTNGRLLPLGLYRFLTRARRIDQIRLALLGVLPEARSKGVYHVLLAELFRLASTGGYRRGEASWVLEDNEDVNRVCAELGGRRYKTYRIFQKTCA
jgi:hypothetical protein